MASSRWVRGHAERNALFYVLLEEADSGIRLEEGYWTPSVTIVIRAGFRAKRPIPGVLDMEHFDAIFVRVDEAEIVPPCSTQCLAVGVCFRPKSIPATFVGESNN